MLGYRRTLLGVSLAIVLLSVAAAASENEVIPVRLSYAAPFGCPSPEDFQREVEERSRRGRFADTEAARSYRVTIRREGSRWIARLRIEHSDAEVATRTVGGDDCSEVASAIALVTALAMDAAVREESGEAVTARPERAQSPRAADATPKDAGPEKESSADVPNAVPPGSVVEDTPRTSSTALGLQLGGRATLTSPKAPRALFGGEVFGALAFGDFDWLVELSLGFERGGRVSRGEGRARFTFLGGRTTVCVTLWRPTTSLRVLPCMQAELGAVYAEGFSDQPASVVDPWFAASPVLRLALGVGSLSIEAQGGLMFPLRVRDRFVFGETSAPEVVIHDVPEVGGSAAVGLGWSFD